MYMKLEREDWSVLTELALKIASITVEEMEYVADPDKEPDFEEKALYAKMAEQLEFMAVKYGPHPLILDTRADFVRSPEEKILLKEEAKALCFQDDYNLRGSLSKELAELYFEDKGDCEKALSLVGEAVLDLESGKDLIGLAEAKELRTRILSYVEDEK